MKSKLMTLFVLYALLAACSKSNSSTEIPTALAETQALASSPALQPTNTIAPTATSTLAPTTTSAPEPTFTLEPTPTPDTRVISGDPEDYILQKGDLPDKYILQSGDSSPHLNTEIISVRGAEEGKKYLEATGRIGGWIIRYTLASTTAIAPKYIRSYVVMYESIKGPELTMGPEWNTDYYNGIKDGTIQVIETDFKIGDESVVYQVRERQSSGKFYIWNYVEFRYRNIWMEIRGSGDESDVSLDYLIPLAEKAFSKLQNAPLKDAP